MTRHVLHRAGPVLVLLGVLGAGPSAAQLPTWTEAFGPPAPAPAGIRSAILPGAPTTPVTALPATVSGRPELDLNFPAVEVSDLSKAVLGNILGLPFTVSPSAKGTVSFVTGRKVARTEILTLFEEALRTSGFALARQGATYAVLPLAEARAQAAALGGGEPGFGSETIALKYVSGAELKKLLDPVVPGAVSAVDPTTNAVVISGTTTQRSQVRALVAQFDVDWLRGMSFGLFIPRKTDSRLIAPDLDRLINAPGAPTSGLVRLIAMERLNGILAVTSQPALLEDVRRFIEVLDREGESTERRLYVYQVQNGRSADLAKNLSAALGIGAGGGAYGPQSAGGIAPAAGAAPAGGISPTSLTPVAAAPAVPAPASGGQPAIPLGSGGATITSDEENNALLVFATPREYAVIEDGLRKVDILPLQVLIEAAITEVQLNYNLRYGVQWLFKAGGNTFNLSQGATGTPTSTFPGFSYFYTNGNAITATLNALSSITTINVLSSPRLMVLNNHTASLQVGDQVPIATGSSTSTIAANAPIVNTIEYRDTGVILKVTPRVNSGGLVLLDVAQEVSDVSTTDTSSLNSPTIQQRRIASSVAVQDGETIALGGLIRDNSARTRNGVPILSSIPVLGALVGNHGKTQTRTELLVLLTPHVVRSRAEAKSITDELREKIQALSPPTPLNSFRP